MQNSYLNHPAEEALERYLLNQSPEDEVDVVETHILACHGCVSRLETLEAQIAAMRTALLELQQQSAAAAVGQQHRSWKTWFTVPHMAWAGAAAVAVAAGLAITPQFVRHSAPAAEVSLFAYRGLESPVVPEGRPLHIHFNAADLPDGPVLVQLVNYNGAELWKSSGVVRQDRVDVTAPKITNAGSYFFRLYETGQNGREGELLREFSFQAK